MSALFSIGAMVLAVGSCAISVLFMSRSQRDQQALIEYKQKHELLQREMMLLRTLSRGKTLMPSFGLPELKVFDPVAYGTPLLCSSCNTLLVKGESFYKIPVTNHEPDSVVAVHLRCERSVRYG